MSAGLSAAAIGGIAMGVGSIASSVIGANGAESAANTQAQATQSQIAQQNYEFNTIQGLLQPYVSAGTNVGLPGEYGALNSYTSGLQGYEGILGQLNNLTGANGNSAQMTAINGLKSNPLYTTSMNLGQQAILANASATGGLRGGNTIANLGYLPGQILSNVMQQQIGNLGTSLNGQSNLLSGLGTQVNQYANLAGLGQNSAAGTGQAALQTGNNVTSLIGQNGAIGAGATLAGTNAITSGINGVSGALGNYLSGANNSALANQWGSAAGTTVGNTPQDLIASYTG